MKLPGDKSKNELIKEIVRVNHAGEYGAKRIYQGQLLITKDPVTKATISHMAEQEEKHLKFFEQELISRKTRPSLLFPVWHIAGFLLGASTAILGRKAAMICTGAVEEVICEHYRKQIDLLDETESNLKNHIKLFRDEEQEHHDISTNFRTNSFIKYNFLARIIKIGCKISIFLAKKI